jgi:hypothetical protein
VLNSSFFKKSPFVQILIKFIAVGLHRSEKHWIFSKCPNFSFTSIEDAVLSIKVQNFRMFLLKI